MNARGLNLLVSVLCITILLIPLHTDARDTHNITPAEISMAESFYPDSVVSRIYHADIIPHWIRNDTFWFTDHGRNSTEYTLVNATTRQIRPLVDLSRLAASLSAGLGKKITSVGLRLFPASYSPEDNTLSISQGGRQWSCNLSSYTVSETTLTAPVQAGVRSPDGKKIAYVNGDNLNLYDLAQGTDTPLTTDGTQDYFYGKRSDTVRYAATEARLNESPEAYLVWSPDSQKIRTFRVNQRNVSPLSLLQNAPENGVLRPILYTYRFAMPGDVSVPLYEPVIIDTQSAAITPVQYKPQSEVSMMDTDQYVLQWWSPDCQNIYSLYLERGEKTIRFLTEDPKTGATTEKIVETGPSYRESSLQYADTPNIAVLQKTGEIIWFSERDGWGHLYRYDADGNQKNQITSGAWVVRKIQYIDEDRSSIYFTASGKEPGNPYYRYLYRVQTDGTALTLLTPEYADHEITMSPDGQFFTDSFSRVDLPPEFILRAADGGQAMQIASADITDLTSEGWKPPKQVTVKARDGITDLYGLVTKPTNFNDSATYPIVDIVYPGPYTIVTSTRFPSDLSWNSKIYWTGQMLAELGYIVVNMDGLGTAYRSKTFHNVSYGHLSDAGLPDHIAGITQIAEQDPSMDVNRVGIYGKSAGGFMTAQAMLTYPDFFKVGVAASGNYDSRLYGSFWGEKYEGMPDETDYQEQVTGNKASNMSGKLLLLTGDMDDNVHPSMTTQLEENLITANKSFDMFIFPDKNHDLNYDPDYIRKMMGYFVKHL
jgi:dipeptidyl-peptidase-4